MIAGWAHKLRRFAELIPLYRRAKRQGWRWLRLLLAACLAGGLAPTPAAAALPSISIGSCAVVVNSNSAGGLKVRNGPGTNYTQVDTIYDGTVIRITAGPASGSGYTWWQHDHGGWSASAWLADTSCGGGSGNVQLLSGLQFSPSSPQVGQSASASFTARNNGSASITLGHLGVKCRRNSDDANYDFAWQTNVTLSPGQEYHYSTNRSFDPATSFWCTANYSHNGNWNDVKWPNGSTNYVTVNVQNAVSQGRLVLIQDLSLSSTSPQVNQNINGNFRVKNIGGQAMTLDYLGIQGRLDGNVNGTARDFNWVQNLTLQPGEEYGYSSDRSFEITGSWTLRPNFKPSGGDWSDVHRENGSVNTVWITVQNTPAPNGGIELVTGLQLSPANPAPGQSVNARVTVRNPSGNTFTAPFFGVKGRFTNGDIDYSFGWLENFSLAPGASYTFDGNRGLDREGAYWFTANYYDGSNWQDVKWSNGTTNYVNLTVGTSTPGGCYSLTTGASPGGSGSISRDRGGNCNGGAGYLQGTVVQLIAAPSGGYAFTGWSGGPGGSANPIYVTVNGDTSVTANFASQSSSCFTVTLDAGQGGTLNSRTAPNCSGGYLSGTEVEIEAVADSGYQFNYWNNDSTVRSNPLRKRIYGNTIISGHFSAGGGQAGGDPVILVHGYQGANPWNAGHNCTNSDGQPNIYRYSSQSDSSEFWQMAEMFENQGYDVWIAHYNTSGIWAGIGRTDSLEENAACLRKEIEVVWNDSSVNERKVTLVAHSMGGIVSRRCTRDPACGRMVGALYTLGSPHAGLNPNITKVPWMQEGLIELTRSKMVDFNTEYSVADGVRHTFIAGDLVWRPLFLSEGRSDAIVGTNSALGWTLSGDVDPDGWDKNRVYRIKTDECHSGVLVGCKAYMDYRDDPNYANAPRSHAFNCIMVREAQIGPIDYCNNVSQVALDTSGGPQLNQTTESLTGQLTAANSAIAGPDSVHTLQIDTSAESVFMIYWSTPGEIDFTLQQPDGTTITPSTPASNGNVSYDYFAGSAEIPPYKAYTFNQTMPGAWTLIINAGDAADAEYVAFASLDSPRELAVTTNAGTFLPGQVVDFTATLTASGVGVTGGSVAVEIRRSDGAVDTLPLVSQGNGQYTGSYTAPDVPGQAVASVVAHATANGVPFSRQTEVVLGIASNQASVAGVASHSTPDVDSNGLFDSLDVSVNVSASSAGAFVLSGKLLGGGQTIAQDGTYAVLAAGDNVVMLNFNGQAIRNAQIDGPFTVEDLRLARVDAGGVPTPPAGVAWATPAYGWQSFGGGCVSLSVIVNPVSAASVTADPPPNCTTGQNELYTPGTQVQLTRTGEQDAGFLGWSGDASGAAQSVALTLESDRIVAANYIDLSALTHRLYLPRVAFDYRPPTPVYSLTAAAQASDGEVVHNGCADWQVCRSAAYGSFAFTPFGGATAGANFDSGSYLINRVFLFFDTSALPLGAGIQSAVLNFYAGPFQNGANLRLHVVQSLANPSLSYADFGQVVFASGGSADLSPNTWQAIALHPAAFPWLAGTGITRLALVHDLDLNNNPPAGHNNSLISLTEDPDHPPTLTIEYTLP